MGVAALVLGIISVVLGFIPLCGIIALVPAIVGLILGIIDLVRKKKASEKFGKALAGLICSAVAIVVIIAYYVLVIVGVGVAANKAGKALNEVDWNEVGESLNRVDWNQTFSDYE